MRLCHLIHSAIHNFEDVMTLRLYDRRRTTVSYCHIDLDTEGWSDYLEEKVNL
jgi:hypothetical protein